jgi:hypothetical protein
MSSGHGWSNSYQNVMPTLMKRLYFGKLHEASVDTRAIHSTVHVDVKRSGSERHLTGGTALPSQCWRCVKSLVCTNDMLSKESPCTIHHATRPIRLATQADPWLLILGVWTEIGLFAAHALPRGRGEHKS